MVDLHIHSKFSDGDLDVKEIIKKANENNISVISITDHDNIESASYILKNQLCNDICCIPGIELSSESYFFQNKMKIHILGYGYNLLSENLNNCLAKKYNQRANDNELFVHQIIKLFPFMSYEMFYNFDYGRYGWIKKLIFNQVASYLKSNDLLKLREYLENFKPNYNNYNFSVEESIELIRNAGGYSVIAHPYRLNISKEQFETFLDYLIDVGINGIEAFHKESSVEQSIIYNNIANENKLYKTGGSDFHSLDDCLGTTFDYLKNNTNPLIRTLLKENKVYGGKR